MTAREHDTESLFREFSRVVAPPPDLTVSEWADLYRKLSTESSAEPGQWRTERAPYQREIMNAISDPEIQIVVVMTSSQIGKTEFVLNVLGYHVHLDPAPIMVIQPTKELAQAFSKDRLAPMIRDTPVIQDKVADAKSRDSGNTMLHKTFPGGHITLVGANAPSGLASRPIRILLADEVDRYPASAGSEGDPLTLARKRTNTFWNRKIVYVSTPGIKGVSRIEAEYDNSTMEQWHLPCPSCGHHQPLAWGQIVFDSLSMVCNSCGCIHNEFEWKSGIGKWIARNPGAKSRGFHLNELASPWKRWEEIIDDFKKAEKEAKKGNIELLKSWVNTSLGETWEEKGEGVESDELVKRRERYDCEVPSDALVLTCGVDVQDNRLEYEIVGWGLESESWGIQYGVIMGDPGQLTKVTSKDGVEIQSVWELLDDVLTKSYTRKDGKVLQIMTTCVDTGGHHTKTAYKFCKPREIRRVWAIKGSSVSGAAFINRPKKRNNAGVWLFSIGVDAGKDTLTSNLKIQFEGPGYCHFPIDTEKGYDQAYFDGLTSEHRVTRWVKGQAKISWEKRTSGARNEPFDLRNYATAAFEILNPPLEKIKKLQEVEKKEPKEIKVETKPTRKRAGLVNKGVQI
ncbi:phage terminase large subunit family protein [Desulfosporosinus sp. OT]|uniref:phage terminase large subunit family protein n=1 Tax=Desulfosporosinus sp. OT TaxID=913865 RepID=UPI000223A5E1|nr:phage terminase large subunit family protein [Desulfosporosinus sp. OT]EGW39174.1 phage terminase large subunit family protein [Desulfosporosinus sp. OT]